MNGILISLEGPDGAGKTTVLKEILPEIQKMKREIVPTREPGGVRVAEEIRQIILDPKNTEIDSKTELMLFAAARRLHMQEKMLPALQAGKVVIVDRFIDSSVAYQGYGRDLGVEVVDWLNYFATDGLKPDLTLYFDVESEIGLARIAKNADREVNRLDLEKLDMHKRVRQGYLALAQTEERIVTIDASRNLDQVVAEATQVILEQLS